MRASSRGFRGDGRRLAARDYTPPTDPLAGCRARGRGRALTSWAARREAARSIPGIAEDRYEPLPGLLGLPRFVWARTSHHGRIAVVVLAAVAVVGTIVAVPLIVSGKHAGAERDRREEAAGKARKVAFLRVDQAPHRGRAVGLPKDPDARRAAVVVALQGAVTADAQARYRAGKLRGPIVRSTRCDYASQQLTDLQPQAVRHGGNVLDCLAATTLAVRPGGTRFAVGYEFIATANWRRGTFTWCKTNPPPGEKFGGVRRAEVRLQAACIDPAR